MFCRAESMVVSAANDPAAVVRSSDETPAPTVAVAAVVAAVSPDAVAPLAATVPTVKPDSEPFPENAPIVNPEPFADVNTNLPPTTADDIFVFPAVVKAALIAVEISEALVAAVEFEATEPILTPAITMSPDAMALLLDATVAPVEEPLPVPDSVIPAEPVDVKEIALAVVVLVPVALPNPVVAAAAVVPALVLVTLIFL